MQRDRGVNGMHIPGQQFLVSYKQQVRVIEVPLTHVSVQETSRVVSTQQAHTSGWRKALEKPSCLQATCSAAMEKVGRKACLSLQSVTERVPQI